MSFKGFLCRERQVRAFATALLLVATITSSTLAQDRAGPIFENGQAQIVPAFEDTTLWIRQELWVEAEFDTDGDGRPDRLHVAVVRPGQTDTEGLKVPIIYESSPYFAGTSGDRTFAK